MTRPQIIRADTIDLQASAAPSTQRHPRAAPDGSIALHQAETLREVAVESAEENLRSPRISWVPDSDDIQQHALALDSTNPLDPSPATAGPRTAASDSKMRGGAQQDALAIAQNGGHSGTETDEADLEGDAEVDMDDDMMDKISSSPSIEDGGSTSALPALPPSNNPDPSPDLAATQCSPPAAAVDNNVCDTRSSSPYLESPDHLPLRSGAPEGVPPAITLPFLARSTSRHHHHCHDGEFETIQGPAGLALREIDRDDGQGSNEDDDLMIPYEPESDDDSEEYYDDDGHDGDDDDGDSFALLDPQFIDSGWGSECLQKTEDIDFDFVYALHTFVATVEGQANATKGDTMVLLDDSNSYWWLLSASMLGDQPDKAKNTIRTAMKRRKAKNVQFAAPTYVDYSEFDYSTEEEDGDAEVFSPQQSQQTQQSQQSTGDEMEDETAKVEPLKPRSQQKQQAKAEAKRQEPTSDADSSSSAAAANKTMTRVVEEVSEVKSDGPKKTSNGTVRDSFFKDDTVETKKITLTPNLLRDDNGPRTSSESREVKPRPSLDKLDKDIFSKDDKKKKKDKDKDKKPGGLRGFFSRKDKKSKGEDDDDSMGKRSMDADIILEKDEDEEPQLSPEKGGPQRNPSKLQKQQPRAEPSPTRKPNSARDANGMDVKSFLSEGRVNNVANNPPASMRLVEASPKGSLESSPRDQQRPDKSPLSKASAARAEPRLEKTTRAKARVELDEFDSDEDLAPEPTRQAPAPQQTTPQQTRSAQGPPPSTAAAAAQPSAAPAPTTTAPSVTIPAPAPAERLSESPVQVSPAHSNNPPPLVVDNSSQEESEDRVSPRSTPSPELVEHDDDDDDDDRDTSGVKTATTPSTVRSESWDDSSLRAFFDSGSDIRDLLVVVYDKNNVDEVAPESVVGGGLFREQNAKLAEITTRLDDMLGDWLARKQRLRGTV
ncbi:hypothetical protein C8A05DRAFT_12616 [Staphylotrichum tortipilum]|uniref:SH3 domain-containing protein n=1 Tax=Staphylotrichum tortipilum TaxID=2831512 RepID=A0AAN6MRA8_9PEZI|nr:hypothetical protein C8A05DRAFT_12616 [Staphylotrichum longicolle]